jgi:phosphoglycolate phosphatase
VKIEAVIFDLDGTLLDTLSDIADSTNNVLAKRGYPTHPVDDYRYFVGDGVKVLIERVLPAGERNPVLVDQCVMEMREEYARNWNVKSRPYAGVPALLTGLVELGLELAVLSNKPDDFTRKCVDALLPDVEFGVVVGQRAGVPQKPDPAGAVEVARRLDVRPQRIVLMGDSGIDMQTAVNAEMYPVGVLWGFRSGAELTENGARLLLARPEELLDFLNANNY